MKTLALRAAGSIFILMGFAQGARFAMRVPVMAGSFEVPVWVSGAAMVVLISLGCWMFKASAE